MIFSYVRLIYNAFCNFWLLYLLLLVLTIFIFSTYLAVKLFVILYCTMYSKYYERILHLTFDDSY